MKKIPEKPKEIILSDVDRLKYEKYIEEDRKKCEEKSNNFLDFAKNLGFI
jgi:hypothetical protein